jgi:pimeloyl-ACP methyl ester carboxylesterase
LPAVFVHGVPDTHRVWDSTIDALRRPDTVRLQLPGFGCPRPPGFNGTKDEYVAWLSDRLADIEGPLDLVGHDWGGLLVLRVLSLAPQTARSWVVGGSPLDPDYRWHRLARRWQTPLLGELVMAAFTPPRMRHALVAAGLPPEYAATAAAAIDGEMKRSVLSLYRSARRVGAQWTPGLERIRSPGLVLWGENDPYVAVRFGAALARRTGAAFRCFEGCGHWWQCERPADVAAELTAHWQTPGRGER